jgi:hypothetical protein
MRSVARRRLRIAAGFLLAAALCVYALRWPLFESLVRARIAETVREELGAEIEIGRLGGSLLFSLTLERVSLRFPDGFPKAVDLRRADLSYGFLGAAPIDGRLRGAEVRFDPQAASADPLQETLRELTGIVRRLHWDGILVLDSLRSELPDGTRLELEDVRLEGGVLSARGRADGWGDLEAECRLGSEGALKLRASSTEGPLRNAAFELDPGEGPARACRGSFRAFRREFVWKGLWTDAPDGLLERLEGRIDTDEGGLDVRVDLRSGRVSIAADASLRLEDPLEATFRISGRAEGPLEGPWESWTTAAIEAVSSDASWRGLKPDRLLLRSPGGRFPELPFVAEALLGSDRAEAEGTLRWEDGPRLQAQVRVRAATVEPYREAADLPADLRLEGLELEGDLSGTPASLRFQGRTRLAGGEWGDLRFREATAGVEADALRVRIREGRLEDLAGLSGLAFEGDLDLERDGFRVSLAAGPDRVSAEGGWNRQGGIDAALELDGPLDFLERWDVDVPSRLKPFRVRMSLGRKEGAWTGRAGIGWAGMDGAALRFAAAGDRWSVDLEPGTLRIPGLPGVAHEGLSIAGVGDRIGLREGVLRLVDPAVVLRLSSGELDGVDGRREVRIGIASLDVEGVSLGSGTLKLAAAGREEAVTLDLALGPDLGDQIRVRGRVLPEPDLEVSLVIPSLDGPLLRRAVGSFPLRGALHLDGRLAGSREDPRFEGRLRLDRLAVEELDPFDLSLPLRADLRELRIERSERQTPVGTLVLEGRLLFGDLSLDAEATLETTDFGFLARRLPREHRDLVPAFALLRTRARASGPLGKAAVEVAADVEVASYDLPAPLGRIRDLRAKARLDPAGLTLSSLSGTLGRGPFRASGSWAFHEPGRPLEATLQGRDLLLVDRPMMRVRIDPEVRLSSRTEGGYQLTGRLGVPLCLVHEDLGPSSETAGRKVEQLRAPRFRLSPAEGGGFHLPGIPGLEALSLDLAFTTPGEIRVENSLVGVLLSGSGRVRGSGASPALSGTFKVLRGEIKLATGLFVQVLQAEAQLPPEPARPATLRFRGRVGQGRGAVGILLDGPLDRPTLRFESDLRRSQEELLASLAFGRGPGEMSGVGALGSLAIKVVEQTFDDWPSAERTPGFFSGLTGQFNLGLVMEEESSRLAPWELPPAGSARGTVVRTEYLINSWLSVTAESDRGANVSGDLKLRLKFR